jgi:hypothetical protein
MIAFCEIMDIVEVDEDSYLPLTTEEHETTRMLQITTLVHGYNCGRIYRFRPTADSFKVALLVAIQQNSFEENKKLSTKARIDIVQRKVRAFYNAKPTQCTVALLTMMVSSIIDFFMNESSYVGRCNCMM